MALSRSIAVLAAGVMIAALPALAPAPVRAESGINEGILGEWEAKPFIWHIEQVKGCRYHQFITVDRQIAPGRFAGRYRARTTCATRSWDLHGKITLTVSGDTVTINGNPRGWIVETVRYRSPSRMEGKDARGHPMIYVRPKGLPTS
jgi:hypothetical protein